MELVYMKDTDKQKKFIELRGKNWSFNKIAKEIKVSKSTLIKWDKEFTYEIANIHQMELEALYEEFKMTKEQRLEYLGKLQKKLIKELEKRDLTDVKTDKLLDMLLKTNDKLENLNTIFTTRVKTEEEIEIQKSKDARWEALTLI